MSSFIKRLLLFNILFLTCFIYANVFNTLNYSGRIVDSDGSPKTGLVNLEIKFFDSESGGLQKGSTYLYPSTPLNSGIFNLEININNTDIPTVLDSSTDTWIEVIDTTNSITYPRQKLSSVPYSQQAGGLAGYPLPSTSPASAGDVLKWDGTKWTWSADAISGTPNSVTSSDIMDGAVETAKLQNNAVTTVRLQTEV